MDRGQFVKRIRSTNRLVRSQVLYPADPRVSGAKFESGKCRNGGNPVPLERRIANATLSDLQPPPPQVQITRPCYQSIRR
jgi:hypothetical protein